MSRRERPLPIRIFLSSPGDVVDERTVAITVIDRLAYEPSFRGRVALETVAWDRPGAGAPMLVNATPQASIDAGLPRPSACEIVAVVIWTRMGTPLPHPEYQKADGSAFLSGTEWEFEDALRGAGEQGGRPSVLLYRCSRKLLVDPDSPDFDERVAQKRLVDAFFERLRDPRTGAILGAHKSYESPDEFRAHFEQDLRTLVHRLLEADVAPRVGTAPREGPAPLWEGSPFPGLRAFTPSDAPIYFGRGRETDELVVRVAEHRFVAVVGASGSGKSSLVGAGLIPRLAGGAVAEVDGWLLPAFDRAANRWTGLRFTPGELGDDPFLPLGLRLAPLVGDAPREIAAVLAEEPGRIDSYLRTALTREQPGGEALLVVDQFEELFTAAPGRTAEFVTLLEHVARSRLARVVATLRSDYYDRCVELPPLARLLERGQFPLAPPHDLFEMIARPAERAGLRFEEGLATRILADAGREPGALPLLAYALDELYRTRRDASTLSVAAYEALGGVAGAIGTRAEDVFQRRLDDVTRDRFSRVFRELVGFDEQGQIVRRRVPLAEIADDERTSHFVEVFTDARLLVQAGEPGRGPTVSVAHEALFGSWARLRDWIEIASDDLRLMRRVRAAAQEWADHGRDDGYLWPQERLEPVYDAIGRLEPTLSAVEELFIRPEYERLADALAEPSLESHRRQVIADRLVAIGPASVEVLLNVLRSTELESVRETTAFALARLGTAALPGLTDAVQDPNVDVRLAAVAALRESENERAAAGLGLALRDADTRVRSLAAGALAALGGPAAAEALGAALEDEDIDVRWRAAGTLGGFGELAVPRLVPLLRDSDDVVRSAARDALIVTGARGLDHLLEALRRGDAAERGSVAEVLAALGSPAVPFLVRALADDDVDVRWRAAESIGAAGDASTAAPLARALTDGEPAVRRAAATALGVVGGRTEVSALIAALADSDAGTAQAAAAALISIGVPAVEQLARAVRESRRGGVRSLAAVALGEIGQPAVRALVELMHDADEWVRRRAVDALVTCGPVAVTALVEVLGSDRAETRRAAVSALRGIGERAEPAIVEAARAPDARVRRHAVAALAGAHSGRARSALEEALSDEDGTTRAAAADALAMFGEQALPPLFRALRSADPAVRTVAARGLARAGGSAIPGLIALWSAGDDAAREAAADALQELGTTPALFALAGLGASAQSEK